MSLLNLLEQKAEILLSELKARCEHLRNLFGPNAHAHIDPLVDALQAHIDTPPAPPVADVKAK